MIQKLTIMACCFAAAVAVSFTTASQADAQVFSQRGYRAGHYVGNTARAFTNTTRNMVNRSNRFWNGNRYGYNNYTYQNGSQNFHYQNQDQTQFQNQNQDQKQDFTKQNGNVNVNTTQTKTFPYMNSTGSTKVTPARSYTPIPTPASESMRNYKP